MPRVETPTKKRGPYAGAEHRRGAILDAAFRVFADHGYQGGSLQMVADRVGMSQTSLLHYFPRKRDLLLAVLQRRDELAPPLAEIEASGAALRAAVSAQVQRNAEVPGLIELYTVLAGEAVTADNPGRAYIATRIDAVRDEFAVFFERIAATGQLRPGCDPRDTATSFVALWDGLQQQWLLAPDRIDIGRQLDRYLQDVLADSPDGDTG